MKRPKISALLSRKQRNRVHRVHRVRCWGYRRQGTLGYILPTLVFIDFLYISRRKKYPIDLPPLPPGAMYPTYPKPHYQYQNRRFYGSYVPCYVPCFDRLCTLLGESARGVLPALLLCTLLCTLYVPCSTIRICKSLFRKWLQQ